MPLHASPFPSALKDNVARHLLHVAAIIRIADFKAYPNDFRLTLNFVLRCTDIDLSRLSTELNAPSGLIEAWRRGSAKPSEDDMQMLQDWVVEELTNRADAIDKKGVDFFSPPRKS